MDRNMGIRTTNIDETSTNNNIDYPVYFITGGGNLDKATDEELDNSLSQQETIDIELTCSSDDDMPLSEYDVILERETENGIGFLMVKITTKQQFEMLIEKMKANPNLARGMRLFGETKSTTDEVWKGIAESLNSYGPPTRDPDEWQRVWIHFKAKLKKKIAQNRRNPNITGCESSQEVPLSPLEQAAADLLQIDLAVNPNGNMFSVVETLDAEQLIEIEPNIEMEQQQFDKQIKMDNARHIPRKIKDRKVGLLLEQTATQSEILSTLKKIEKHLYKRNEIMKEIRDLKRKKYELLKEIKEMKKSRYEALAEKQQLNQKIKRTKLEVLQKLLESLCTGSV